MNLIPDGQGFPQVFRAWEDSAPLEGEALQNLMEGV